MLNGKYVIFEGADGVGKSTLAKNYAEYTGSKYTFEPFGHTDLTTALRRMALTKSVPQLAREYLLLANRDLGYQDLDVWLSEGNVVSDRSFVSGMVYAYMEGFSFEDWMRMSLPLIVKNKTMPIFVLCQNTDYKNKTNPEDRYDGRGEQFHNSVSENFKKAFKFLGISPLCFNISFNQSREENLHRLLEELDCYERQEDSWKYTTAEDTFCGALLKEITRAHSADKPSLN